jgi:hypothetical protein
LPDEAAVETPTTAKAADAPVLKEATIYEKNGITVTPKVLKTPNASFQMANLSSVQAIDGKAGAALLGYGCGGCSGIFGLVVMLAIFNAFEHSAGLGLTYLLVGSLAVGVGYALVSTAGKGNHWSVNVDKGNNTPVPLQSNMTEADAKELEAAINEAFTRLRTST